MRPSITHLGVGEGSNPTTFPSHITFKRGVDLFISCLYVVIGFTFTPYNDLLL